MNVFLDIGLIIILATVGGFIARMLKQPLIAFYILMGVILGPLLGFIQDMELITVLSEIGIAFLLFIVGIELDLKKLKAVGGVATVGALVQMAVSFGITFAIFYFLDFGSMFSAYAGFILLFSSTMVIIKLLSDKGQLNTLHGRIVIGTLLIQDVVAVVLLSVMANISHFSLATLALSVSEAILLFGAALFFSKFIFPKLFKYAAKNQELFFLLSLSICFGFSLLFTTIGFSIAIGAFIAGLMLGNLPYNVEIIAKVKSLRDFFATLFFVSMGLKLSFGSFASYSTPFLILLVLTVVIAPFITFFSTLLFGYNKKTAFLTAIALTQVSEFSLILVYQGERLGHIGSEFLSLTILLTLASIVVTSYFMKYQDKIYKFSYPFLKQFDRFVKTKKIMSHAHPTGNHKMVLVGMDRIGYTIYKKLRQLKKDVLIVDYNPDVVASLIKQKIPCMYGDIADEEILEKIHLSHVEQFISTVPAENDTLLFIKKIRQVNKEAKIIVTAYTVDSALLFYEAGADYVILPHLLGGAHAGVLIESVSNDFDKLVSTRIAHIDELKDHKKKYDAKHFLQIVDIEN